MNESLIEKNSKNIDYNNNNKTINQNTNDNEFTNKNNKNNSNDTSLNISTNYIRKENSFVIRKQFIFNRLKEVDNNDDNEIEKEYQNKLDAVDNRYIFDENFENIKNKKIEIDLSNTSKTKEAKIKEEIEKLNKSTSPDSSTESNGTLTNFQGSLYIINTIMGAGIVMIPVVYKFYGIILGTIVMFLFGILPYISTNKLLTIFTKTGESGYATYAKISFGSIGTLIMKWIILINSLGVTAVYFNSIAAVLNNIVKLFITDENSIFISSYKNWFYVVLIALFMTLIVFREKVEALKHATLLGTIAIITFVLSLICLFVVKASHNELVNDSINDMLFPRGELYESLSVAPAIISAFGFLYNLFPVHLNLITRTQSNTQKISLLSILFCGTIYITVGIAGYFLYGFEMKDSVLTSILIDMEKSLNSDNNKYSYIILIVSAVSFLILALVSIPMVFMSLKSNLVDIVIQIKKRNLLKKQKGKEYVKDISFYFYENNINDSNNSDNNIEKKAGRFKSINIVDDYDNEYIDNSDDNIKISNYVSRRSNRPSLKDNEILSSTKKQRRKTANQIRSFTKEELAKRIEEKYITYFEKMIYIISIYILIVIIAITTNISMIFGFIGCTTGNLINFIAPNVFFVKIAGILKSSFKSSTIGSRILTFVGFILMITCLIGNTVNVFKKK